MKLSNFLFLVFLPFSLYSSNWTDGASNDNWSDSGNWDGGVPNEANAEAVFPTLGTAQTVVVDQGVTVGTIHFTATDNYSINGPET